MTYVVREEGGTITVTDGTLTQIVVQAAEGVEGTRVRRARRKLALEIEDAQVRVELEVAVAYGKVLPDVAHEVQAQVSSALARMCGLDVRAVDVTVGELDRR
ncbi:MAG TPA: Asp23/Gls24 family envelope stress response protein [Gaiellaceae bacterium]|nr:Asp23/Gls24 family envelope stress response protein [Gaiellaceae bacterium]